MVTSIAEKTVHRPYLDGLRGISILLVLCAHTVHSLRFYTGMNFTFPFIEGFVAATNQGVKLFFLVSAFTLFSSYYSRLGKEAQPWRNFYLRRFFRIFPFWWGMVAVYLLFGAPGASFLPSAFMYFGFLRFDPLVEVTHVQWSLFVEETFYLALPLLFSTLRTLQGAFTFFFVTLFASYVWNTYGAVMGVPDTNQFIDFFPLSQWYCFAIGILLYFLSTEKDFQNKVLKEDRWATILSIGAFVFLAQMIRQIAPYSTVALAAVFVASMHPGTIWGRITRNPLMGTFGITCFSIYLIHPLLIRALVPPFSAWLKTSTFSMLPLEVIIAFAVPAMALVNLVVAYFSFSYFEKPFVRLGKKVITRLENRSQSKQTIPRASEAA